MSAPFADQTPARVPGILNNIASELHLNGHLVSTGWIDEGSPGNSLFIHISVPCLQKDHHCRVVSYNAGVQIISEVSCCSSTPLTAVLVVDGLRSRRAGVGLVTPAVSAW
ncbi:hypothetical protein HBI56_195720 [Parastagonospora nodorum]|uniref:Uncharacterized protein n=1 Tax=Phaeosphaeria nodorum (strain SN15 / ATCC MYA-4574 / FGSC 10173) TaxID=321614 RepID=A0A7U2F6D0_PHANO|nr:hypothetical protein HBH56_207650 [Parastagonospora nodorum]QRC99563.1 hypothetical protein JI435_437140 [Parastagonospora nodorum SN15]KAH3923645.1 hypothetical protein HBH54_206520 [Parastagonospora nodorum]KAH3941685.1 hypothetical protein HBH53_200310 [Parastagonospora nodorum]KAH3965211.1 hypothetical protein HBH52_205920 [Parastagonospora nodorum]